MRYASCISALSALLLISCASETAYHEYRHTLAEGWLRSDTLRYDIALRDSGTYHEVIGFRTNMEYPFTSVTLIVCQFVGDKHYTDTVTCEFISADGKSDGRGVGTRQFEFPIGSVEINDSIHIAIHHCMSTDTLRGILDVGVKICGQ